MCSCRFAVQEVGGSGARDFCFSGYLWKAFHRLVGTIQSMVPGQGTRILVSRLYIRDSITLSSLEGRWSHPITINQQKVEYFKLFTMFTIGFDPWDESSRGLADMMEKENENLRNSFMTPSKMTSNSSSNSIGNFSRNVLCHNYSRAR